MPVMNGLQAAPLLRRSLQNVPIILLTLYASVLPVKNQAVIIPRFSDI